MGKEYFEVKSEHLKLLRKMYVSWNRGEFGAPCIDPKRPYGDSDVYADMARILGIEGFMTSNDEWVFSGEETDYMDKLHKETEIVLQIVLDTFVFVTGKYEREKYGGDWIII